MEKFREITVVRFDKTGTLTEGTPGVAEVRTLPSADHMNTDELLALAAGAERPSEHPLARAVVTAATDRGLRIGHVDFSSAPDRGVSATIGSRHVRVGSPALLHDLPADTTRQHPRVMIAELEATGRTAVVVLVDGAPAGVLGFADRHRPTPRRPSPRSRP